MAEFYELNDELLCLIITFLATSANGATDLARLSATCHRFFYLSQNLEVLKDVNFQEISVDDYEAHAHMNDLLCLCARAGNEAAESMIGKALLHDDVFFWHIILEHDLPVLDQYPLASGLLHYQKLVRRFISDASDADISVMRIPLFSYMISCMGYDAACSSGILLAIANMCSYYLETHANVVNDVDMSSLCEDDVALAWLTPSSGQAHCALVLKIYDQMFGL